MTHHTKTTSPLSNKSLGNEESISLISNSPSLQYYLFLPKSLSPSSKILICVHGISRNAKQQITAFRQKALKSDYIIIAPYFSKESHKGYQRLKTNSAGETSADALNRALSEIRQKHSITTNKFTLFGYSGGGQFAHRYAMAYPKNINKLVVCSAGWFTFPTPNKHFPYGVKAHKNSPPKIKENLHLFLQLKILVIIGELDNIYDLGLNQKERINRQQGYHRFERATRWVRSLQEKCNSMHIPSDLRFITLKGCGHSFLDCERFGGISKFIFD